MKDFETVGDILRENPQWPGEGDADEPAPCITPPRLDGQPEFPAVGIYFGMSDADYHAINACSSSLIKDMSVSPMYAWAKSPLNPDREDDDTFAKMLGRAYHCRICEGAGAYAERYAIALDKKDYPDALITADQIKAAIVEAGHKPSGKKKEDWSAQLLEISPDAQIWDALVDAHAGSIGSRELIRAEDDKRIQIAARMIEADPDLSKAFTGGYAEVSLFWIDAATGAPCKARVDYLKLKAFVDLKSFSLKIERPVDRAIDFEIASRKHYIPVAHYSDGIAAVKALVRNGGDCVVDCPADWHQDTVSLVTRWVEKWSNVADDPTPLYVFQATGIAPITRGKILHRGTVFAVTRMAVEMLRRRYVECVKTFGADPWLDRAPISNVTDESVPLSATDFGEN